jgi:hypothetical protein
MRGYAARAGAAHVSAARHRVNARPFLAIALMSALAACGGSTVTEDRVERAIAPLFANLVHAQLQRMGLPDIPVSALRTTASCYRIGGGHEGTGDWACTIVWSGPNGATLRDGYEVAVGANGCFTATLSGSTEAQLGGPTVITQENRQVRNLLYAFDGCFDPFLASTSLRR